MPRIQFFSVETQGPHFARVQYTSNQAAYSYIAEVEVLTFNEVVVLFQPAVYENPDDPAEFSEDDLQAILMLMIRCSVKVTGSRYEETPYGSRRKVFSLERESSLGEGESQA